MDLREHLDHIHRLDNYALLHSLKRFVVSAAEPTTTWQQSRTSAAFSCDKRSGARGAIAETARMIEMSNA